MQPASKKLLRSEAKIAIQNFFKIQFFDIYHNKFAICTGPAQKQPFVPALWIVFSLSCDLVNDCRNKKPWESCSESLHVPWVENANEKTDFLKLFCKSSLQENHKKNCRTFKLYTESSKCNAIRQKLLQTDLACDKNPQDTVEL